MHVHPTQNQRPHSKNPFYFPGLPFKNTFLYSRVAKLDLRDAGTWVCEIGTSTIETFQVQTKEFVIDIESKFFEYEDIHY